MRGWCSYEATLLTRSSFQVVQQFMTFFSALGTQSASAMILAITDAASGMKNSRFASQGLTVRKLYIYLFNSPNLGILGNGSHVPRSRIYSKNPVAPLASARGIGLTTD